MTVDVQRELGEHAIKIQGHHDAIHSLTIDQSELEKDLVKVRIQVAVIVAIGMGFVVVVQAVTAKFIIEAVSRMMGAH